MATNPTSSILLKRSGIQGKVPTTASLQVGELALNTYDGKVFLHKSGSTESVVEVVVTGTTVTGSITLVGAVTASVVSASYFYGDGSGLQNVAISAANNFDFNQPVASGFSGYLQDTGSNYVVTPSPTGVAITTGSRVVANFTAGTGYSGSLYGIGDVLAFSGSIATQFAALQYSASNVDAGEI
jgi:hypothetical protein